MGRTILVVEDDDDLRQMFADALSVAGFKVSQAADGLQALRQLDSNPPDLVVLDLHLPYFSGIEVRKDVESNILTRAIRVVVVSGTPEDLGNLSVDCVLQKPVDPEALVAAVKRCLASHQRP